MRYRKFGSTDFEASEIGFGCWAMGGPWQRQGKQVGWGAVDDAESVRSIHRAFDLGVNFFDTAEAYGLGHSEEVVGRALEGRRGQAILCTKIGKSLWEAEGKTYPAFGRAHHREMIERTLKRLRTDRVDVYLWHEAPDEAILAEAAAAMEELKTEGKILCYGASSYGGNDVRRLLGTARISAVEPNYNLIERREEPGTLAVARENNLGVIARGVLMMGLLTGKFTKDTKFGPTDVRSHNGKFQGERFQKGLALVERLKAFTGGKRTLAHLATQWVLANPAVHTVINGVRTVKQIEENAATMDAPALSAGEKKQIDALVAEAYPPVAVG